MLISYNTIDCSNSTLLYNNKTSFMSLGVNFQFQFVCEKNTTFTHIYMIQRLCVCYTMTKSQAIDPNTRVITGVLDCATYICRHQTTWVGWQLCATDVSVAIIKQGAKCLTCFMAIHSEWENKDGSIRTYIHARVALIPLLIFSKWTAAVGCCWRTLTQFARLSCRI